jgi:hypothetical protein
MFQRCEQRCAGGDSSREWEGVKNAYARTCRVRVSGRSAAGPDGPRALRTRFEIQSMLKHVSRFPGRKTLFSASVAPEALVIHENSRTAMVRRRKRTFTAQTNVFNRPFGRYCLLTRYVTQTTALAFHLNHRFC